LAAFGGLSAQPARGWADNDHLIVNHEEGTSGPMLLTIQEVFPHPLQQTRFCLFNNITTAVCCILNSIWETILVVFKTKPDVSPILQADNGFSSLALSADGQSAQRFGFFIIQKFILTN